MNPNRSTTNPVPAQAELPAGLSAEGKEFLKAALDPYHDTAVRCRGIPDEENSKTTVIAVKKSVAISAPAGTVGNWTAHLFTLPELRRFLASPCAHSYANLIARYTNLGIYTDSYYQLAGMQGFGNPFEFGTLNVHSWTTDVDRVFPDGQGTYTQPAATTVLAPDDADTHADIPTSVSTRRLVGMGFEVVNTTASLTKQGTATVYRVPSRHEEVASVNVIGNNLFTGTGPAVNYTFGEMVKTMPMDSNNGPAGSVREAMTYGGTVQWPAAEGSYQVVTFHMDENPLLPDTLGYPVFMNNTRVTNGAPPFPTGIGAVTHNYSAASSLAPCIQSQWHHRVPADISGVIYSGLSKETTLTVNVIFYIEIAPHLYDPTFGAYVYTSAVSAKYDPAAMRLYSDLSRILPAGVMQNMNPAGEFWGWLVRAAKSAAPLVFKGLGLIDHPVAQALSKIGGLVSDVGKIKALFGANGVQTQTIPTRRADSSTQFPSLEGAALRIARNAQAQRARGGQAPPPVTRNV